MAAAGATYKLKVTAAFFSTMIASINNAEKAHSLKTAKGLKMIHGMLTKTCSSQTMPTVNPSTTLALESGYLFVTLNNMEAL